jgi:putative oxidoreductase
MHLGAAASIVSAVPNVFSIVAAGLLIAGLWTPVSSSVFAAAVLWTGLSSRADLTTSLLVTAIGLALAMLGPGAWSLDARLYGWRRIDVRDPRTDRS